MSGTVLGVVVVAVLIALAIHGREETAESQMPGSGTPTESGAGMEADEQTGVVDAQSGSGSETEGSVDSDAIINSLQTTETVQVEEGLNREAGTRTRTLWPTATGCSAVLGEDQARRRMEIGIRLPDACVLLDSGRRISWADAEKELGFA